MQKNTITNLNELATFTLMSYENLDPKVKLNSDYAFDVEDLFGDEPEEVKYFKGDIHINGNVVIDADDYDYLAIDGNLTIDGTLALEIIEMYTMLIVTGNLTVKNLILTYDATLIVLGKVNVGDLIFTNFGDGGFAYFNGETRSKALLNLAEEIEMESEYIGEEVSLKEEFEELELDELTSAIIAGEIIYE